MTLINILAGDGRILALVRPSWELHSPNSGCKTARTAEKPQGRLLQPESELMDFRIVVRKVKNTGV
jgi:hypothetical protein